MKYLVLLYDGMADYPMEELNGGTPMSVAKKPLMDKLAADSLVGTVSNVPPHMVPESDTANIAVMSYDPAVYSKGRSPLEAVSMGIDMAPDETAYRVNLVTLSEEEENYDDKIMLDHSSDEISTAEADVLIKAVEEAFGTDFRHFYTGVSYRHCLIWKNTPAEYNFMRPHDILGQCIKEHVPQGENGRPFYELMKASYELLSNHPVNLARAEKGLRKANSLWFWSPGKKPALPNFKEKWGLDASVISAVDLIKGIGICAGMKSIDVEGATGNIHTKFRGKGEAAIGAFKEGSDFVYIHVEAPDESGHRAELDNKILSIEKIEQDILTPVYEYLKASGEDFKILCLPDHPTPICKRTHTIDPVPFMIYSSKEKKNGVSCFTEQTAKDTGLYIEHGYNLLDHMIEK